MKKFYRVLTVIIVLILLVSICTAKSNVNFQGWIGMEKASVEAWEIMKSSFEKENTEIGVTYIGTPWEQLLNQLTISTLGGNPPDVAQLTASWMPQMVEMRALEPLDKYFTKQELNSFPEATLESGMYKGKLYSIPWTPGPIILYGRVDLMKAAGLDYEKGPKTWQEFEQWISKITALGKASDGRKIFGFSARTEKGSNSGLWFMPMLWAYGGDILNEKGKVVFNSSATIKALDAIARMAKKEEIPPGSNTRIARNLFAQGQAAFAFDGPWFKGIMRDISGKGEAADGDYRIYTMPAGSKGAKTIANSHMLVLFKNAKNKADAIKLMKYLTFNSDLGVMYYQKSGYLAPTKSVLSRPEFQDPFTKIIVNQIDTANATPVKHPKCERIYDIVSVAVQKAILGQNTKQVAKETAEEIKTLLAGE